MSSVSDYKGPTLQVFQNMAEAKGLEFTLVRATRGSSTALGYIAEQPARVEDIYTLARAIYRVSASSGIIDINEILRISPDENRKDITKLTEERGILDRAIPDITTETHFFATYRPKELPYTSDDCAMLFINNDTGKGVLHYGVTGFEKELFKKGTYHSLFDWLLDVAVGKKSIPQFKQGRKIRSVLHIMEKRE